MNRDLTRITTQVSLLSLLAVLPLSSLRAQGDPVGLWVGEAVLTDVNEAVSARDAGGNVVATPPETVTATADLANLRLILQQWTPNFTPSQARLDGRPLDIGWDRSCPLRPNTVEEILSRSIAEGCDHF